MSKKSNKKTVVVTKKEKPALKATQSRVKASAKPGKELLFGRKNYMFLGISFALILLGMLLMAGGKQLPTEWNENEIYSFRRTVLSPIVILGGLAVGFWAIFTKKN